ncbi:hypothetical protein HD806DRAFT_550547 [Xylariaceae sp. AK1471]|nr:hypothetical protein HD806DRAFT_550547 [Xylariaceae sp. AK1471]
MSDLTQSTIAKSLWSMVAALLNRSTGQIISMITQRSRDEDSASPAGPESEAQDSISPDIASLDPVVIRCFENNGEKKDMAKSIRCILLSLFKKDGSSAESDENSFLQASNDAMDRLDVLFKPTVEMLRVQAEKEGSSLLEHLEALTADYETENPPST